MRTESLWNMRSESYVFTGEKIESHYEYFPDNGDGDIVIFEDIYSGIEYEGINSKRTYVDDKKWKVLSPNILPRTDKGIFFMYEKGNQKDNIKTHARWNEVIKPEYISKGIEQCEIE